MDTATQCSALRAARALARPPRMWKRILSQPCTDARRFTTTRCPPSPGTAVRPPAPHQAGHVLARSCRRSCPAPSRWQSSNRRASARSSPSIGRGSSACAMPAATDNWCSAPMRGALPHTPQSAAPSICRPSTIISTSTRSRVPGPCITALKSCCRANVCRWTAGRPVSTSIGMPTTPQSPAATSGVIAAHSASCCVRW